MRRFVKGRDEYWSESRGEVVDRGFDPAPIPEAERAAVEATLAQFDAWLAPAPPDWIAGRIVTLLAHFWTPDMGDKVRGAVAADWLEIMGGLPAHAIAEACRIWLRTEKWRPKPSELYGLAHDRVKREARHRDRLRQCLEGARPTQPRGGVKPLGSVTPQPPNTQP